LSSPADDTELVLSLPASSGTRLHALACRTRKRNEKGFVVVWFSLLMIVLMACAALAVDLGNWYLNIQRVQRSADAAALDGDVLLPGDVTLAREMARDGLIRNGVSPIAAGQAFTHPTCAATTRFCIAQVPGQSNQLEVHITVTVNNTFLKLIGGARTSTFTRKAIAEHRTGLTLGSGRNALGGSEPATTAFPTRWSAVNALNTKYWPEVGGRDSAKQSGDRTMTDSCLDVHQTPAPNGVYGNNTTPSCTTSNPEYNSTGRWFRIHVDSDASAGSKYLIVQAYDPGFYVTTIGSTPCMPAYTAGVPRLGVNECPGDGPSDGLASTAYTTTYRMRPALNDTGSTLGTCHAGFPGTTNAGSSMSDPNIGPYVHEWVTLCSPYRIDVTKSGDYYLQVDTNSGNGQNSFALRAGLSSTASEANVDPDLSQQLVTISANNIALNYSLPAAGVPSMFALSQVSNQWANQPITFEFFDLGDGGVGNGAGDFEMLDQTGAAVRGTCTYSVSPRAPATVTAPGCAFHYTQANFNGQLVKFTWTPPANYSCAPHGNTYIGGCWIYGRLTAIDASPDDLTTWSLDYPDKPLRLIK
jgi:Flp pilus assembly protein TadG